MEINKTDLVINSALIAGMVLDGNADIIKALGLSKKDVENIRKFSNFMTYNLQFARYGVGDYNDLRAGLQENFNVYLKDIFKKIKVTNRTGNFLDFGAGSGIYSRFFKLSNPKSKIFKLDRHSGMKIDFEQNPAWYIDYIEKFDTVLLSEILHCKGPAGRRNIIHSIYKVLKPGGLVIVNENEDIFMKYRLSKVSKGKMLSIAEIHSLMAGFKFIRKVKIHNHNVMLYEKI